MIPPNLPVPAGATAGNWSDLTDIDGNMARPLTWSRHDTDKVRVVVDGWQDSDGNIEKCVSVYDEAELTAADARRLAAALLNAADELDALQ
ncbi:hypothetical protein A5725_12035 [Mycobacterium kubicae]|uniref:hypothetical protein n=1 Tax=Mycobacterium kubicae TaxID=120959 RepID=UPI0007FE3BED|nr:hypothetical protein [Mycobacterium kubicae]OBF22922.1 hypothetical protein A5725_12035 [Mycobacterium kubicae]